MNRPPTFFLIGGTPQVTGLRERSEHDSAVRQLLAGSCIVLFCCVPHWFSGLGWVNMKAISTRWPNYRSALGLVLDPLRIVLFYMKLQYYLYSQQMCWTSPSAAVREQHPTSQEFVYAVLLGHVLATNTVESISKNPPPHLQAVHSSPDTT